MTEKQKTDVLCEILTFIGLSSMGIGLFLWFNIGVSLTICGIVMTIFGVSGLVRG